MNYEEYDSIIRDLRSRDQEWAAEALEELLGRVYEAETGIQLSASRTSPKTSYARTSEDNKRQALAAAAYFDRSRIKP